MGPNGWVAGVLGLYALVGGVVWVLARPQTREVQPTPWDLPNVARTYTTIIASLAGFAATSVVFVARLGIDRPGPEFETAMGLLLFAVPTLLAAAMHMANMPNLPSDDPHYQQTQRYVHLLANVAFVQGLALGWLGLHPLAQLVGALELAEILRWFLALAVLLGVVWLAEYVEELTPMPRLAAVALAVLALGGAALYRFVVVERAPTLFPGDLEALRLAAVGLLLTVLGYAIAMWLVSLQARGRVSGREGLLTQRAAVALAAVVATSNALLGLTVLTS